MKERMNGSTELLAKAMCQVFQEAVEEGIAPLDRNVDNLREEMHDGFVEVNQHIQAY